MEPGSTRNMLIAHLNFKSYATRAENLQKHMLGMEHPWDVVAIQDPLHELLWPHELLWLIRGIRRTHQIYYQTKRSATENDHPMHGGYENVCESRITVSKLSGHEPVMFYENSGLPQVALCLPFFSSSLNLPLSITTRL